MLGWAILLLLSTFPAVAESFGSASITLQSRRYYSQWDLTRLVYRVNSSKNDVPDFWTLGMGDCIAADQIDGYSSTEFTWVDQPFRGLRFENDSRNNFVYLWLNGQWDVGSVPASVAFDSERMFHGTLDGPLCEGSSISVGILSGASVEFPQLLGAGSFPAATMTRLSVSSTSSGWLFGYSPTFSIPENAQQSVVERIFQIVVEPHDSREGTTELSISYQLKVSDQDFVGLPQGSYVIGIMYTVMADD